MIAQRRAVVVSTAGRIRKWENGGLEHGFYEFPFSWEVHNPN